MTVKMVGKEILEELDNGGLIAIMYFTAGKRWGWLQSYMDKSLWDDWEAGLCDISDWYISEMEEELNNDIDKP